MSRVVLGNRHAQTSHDNGETFEAMPKGKRATMLEIPDDWNIARAFTGITTDPGGAWHAHVHQVKGETPAPAWVASDDPALASLLAAHYGCEVRELETPEEQ